MFVRTYFFRKNVRCNFLNSNKFTSFQTYFFSSTSSPNSPLQQLLKEIEEVKAKVKEAEEDYRAALKRLDAAEKANPPKPPEEIKWLREREISLLHRVTGE